MAPVLQSLLNKVGSLQTCNSVKKNTPAQVFFCEICEIFKYNYFEEYLRTTASAVFFSWFYVHYLRHRFINQNKMQRRGLIFLQKLKIKTVGNEKKKR